MVDRSSWTQVIDACSELFFRGRWYVSSDRSFGSLFIWFLSNRFVLSWSFGCMLVLCANYPAGPRQKWLKAWGLVTLIDLSIWILSISRLRSRPQAMLFGLFDYTFLIDHSSAYFHGFSCHAPAYSSIDLSQHVILPSLNTINFSGMWHILI